MTSAVEEAAVANSLGGMAHPSTGPRRSGAGTVSSAAALVAHYDYDGVPHLRPDVIPPPLVASSTPYMRRDIVIWGDW